MDAGEFEGLLYNMLSEEPFKNKIFYMTDEKYDYTIYDYVSHHFGILTGKTCTYLTCHAKKKKLKDDSFIMSLREISQNEKNSDQLVMRKILIWERAVLP